MPPQSHDPRLPVDDEPAYEAAAVLALTELRRHIEQMPRAGGGRGTDEALRCVAVDGRSASGKSTLARRVVDELEDWALVGTDDLAWHHDFFDWAGLLADGILEPLRRDGEVRYRPPAWESRGRPGAITVPPGTHVLVVEGVGSSRASLAGQFDLAIWVHTPFEEVLRREGARIAAGETDARLSRDWLTAEARFLAEDRPWRRADLVVAGTGGIDAGGDADLLAERHADAVRVLVDPRAVEAHLHTHETS